MSVTTSIALGRLTPVPPREVWPHEAQHFTPWLLQNVDVLGELLQMELVLESAEHAVGNFSLDLIGRDELTGETVIVENQLQTSDHTHLGQILTYAAGADPTTIVWVAAAFRPEHRAALDWLNSRTDEQTRFFGVQLGVVRIGQSEPAPSFRLVAQPNDWEKTVRVTTTQSDPSGKRALYVRFWSRWLERLNVERPYWSRPTRPPNYEWFTMPTGLSSALFYAYFRKPGLSSEVSFEFGDPAVNLEYFDGLMHRREELEKAYGGPLQWEPMPRNKLTRVADFLPGADISHEENWPQYSDWLLDRQTRLRAALQSIGGLASLRAVVTPNRETSD